MLSKKKLEHKYGLTWRKLTSKLRTKLQKLRRSKTIKKATSHLNRRGNYPAKRLRRRYRHHHQGFDPVFVDELFQQTAPSVTEHVVLEPDIKAKSPTIEAAAAASSSSSSAAAAEHYFNCSSVDERAEMFIAKFREEMKLQRQRSLEKYQEMLARGL
ncbi:uncharacterized protein A4U43_C04F780 [Asparagus officinalis]|uniref:DUF761 domain-containing protein n=1 Tax=Asparagus officinalis TaxID=4686 RepID=A0A5P1EXC7_ASPOF|nr:uncharacterized protein A4U43_C04F780 [Asparagus officinalis]